MDLVKFDAYKKAGKDGDKKTERRLLNELVKENEKLVRKLVGQYFKKTMSFSEEEDMYQAGLLAFCMALRKFDPKKYSTKGIGASFATYVGHWVRSYTKRDTAKQQTIICPEGFGMPYSVHRKAEHIRATTGETAKAEQLGTYKVRVKGKTREVVITEDMLLAWKAAQNSVVSLDGSTDADHGRDLGAHEAGYIGGVLTSASLKCPDSSKTPEALFLNAEREQSMGDLMATCTVEERKVIAAIRNGDGSDRLIGKMLGIKEMAARTYKAKLIEKLAKAAKRAA
jgi:RNA polymerase sigma factor (sigma-70 family)